MYDVWYCLAGGGGGVGLADEFSDGVGEPQPQQGEDQHLDSHEHHRDQDVFPQPQVVVLQFNKILWFFFYSISTYASEEFLCRPDLIIKC